MSPQDTSHRDQGQGAHSIRWSTLIEFVTRGATLLFGPFQRENPLVRSWAGTCRDTCHAPRLLHQRHHSVQILAHRLRPVCRWRQASASAHAIGIRWPPLDNLHKPFSLKAGDVGNHSTFRYAHGGRHLAHGDLRLQVEDHQDMSVGR